MAAADRQQLVQFADSFRSTPDLRANVTADAATRSALKSLKSRVNQIKRDSVLSSSGGLGGGGGGAAADAERPLSPIPTNPYRMTTKVFRPRRPRHSSQPERDKRRPAFLLRCAELPSCCSPTPAALPFTDGASRSPQRAAPVRRWQRRAHSGIARGDHGPQYNLRACVSIRRLKAAAVRAQAEPMMSDYQHMCKSGIESVSEEYLHTFRRCVSPAMSYEFRFQETHGKSGLFRLGRKEDWSKHPTDTARLNASEAEWLEESSATFRARCPSPRKPRSTFRAWVFRMGAVC